MNFFDWLLLLKKSINQFNHFGWLKLLSYFANNILKDRSLWRMELIRTCFLHPVCSKSNGKKASKKLCEKVFSKTKQLQRIIDPIFKTNFLSQTILVNFSSLRFVSVLDIYSFWKAATLVPFFHQLLLIKHSGYSILVFRARNKS